MLKYKQEYSTILVAATVPAGFLVQPLWVAAASAAGSLRTEQGMDVISKPAAGHGVLLFCPCSMQPCSSLPASSMPRAPEAAPKLAHTEARSREVALLRLMLARLLRSSSAENRASAVLRFVHL